MAFYKEIQKYTPRDISSIKRWVFVLFDQLSWFNPLLVASDLISTEEIGLVFIETSAKPRKRSYHKQKLVLLLSAMRHFAMEARALNYPILYHYDDIGYANGLTYLAKKYKIATYQCLSIQEDEVYEELKSLGSLVNFHPNNLYLSTAEDFLKVFPDTKLNTESLASSNKSASTEKDRDQSKEIIESSIQRKKYLQEKFYRYMRIKLNILIDPTSSPSKPQPIGGKWNLDHENRSNWKKSDPKPSPVPWFTPDSITQEVIDLVEEKYANHFGNLKDFGWPVTRTDAIIWLEHFVHYSLPFFGKYEDAMDIEENYLFHSMLSPLIHLGLLHPKEVIDRILESHASLFKKLPDDSDGEQATIALSSVEGIIRQIIGWREYMRHVYQQNVEVYQSTNYFNHKEKLPDFYWTADSGMTCIDSIISVVRNRGYSHHITRLMLLSNFANLLGVNPHELNHWFWIAYVDAYEWVVTPNVVGMGTYADGGICSTKPYIASSNYIKKMAPSYCNNCKYRSTELLGDSACPFNSLYWNFIGENEEFYSKSGRTDFALSNWKKFPEEKKTQIRDQANFFKKKFIQSSKAKT